MDQSEREQLLAQFCRQFGLPPESVEATAAWQAYLRSMQDSLAVAELVMSLESELSGRGGG